ncbi:TPA: hypothetical protein R1916_002486, partial [Staphylococcus delphini]|nr:hypothetical protein [Staphylococcus delphini]
TDFLRLIATSLRLQTSTDSSMTTLILLLMSICFPILEAMSIYLQMLIDFSQLIATSLHLPISIDLSTCLLTPIGFLLLTVISLCLPISIDLSTRMSISLYSQTSIGSSIPMLISPHLLICSPMLTSISLLMLIDFPILEVMSTYLLTPIGFSLLIVTSLCLPTSIDLSIPMLISPHLLICSSMLTSILLLMSICFPTL